MKLCFLYSGLSRTLEHSIAILSTLIPSHISFDVAIHLTPEDPDHIYYNRQIRFQNLQKPPIKYLLLDSPIDVPPEYRELKQQNAYHQWYKIKRVFDLLPDPTIYDYIVRIRPDLFILDSKEAFLSHLNSLQPNVLYVPDGFNIYDSKMVLGKDSINDQFAIASPNIMKQYAELFEVFPEVFDTCSEITLASYLKQRNIPIQRLPLSYKLVLSLCQVIAITGDSGVGKSTVADAIDRIFKFDKKVVLETDRYHKWERGHEQWSKWTHLNPEANYLEKMKEDAFNLKIGNEIFAVDYDHHTGSFTPVQKIEPKDNIVLCGLHTLYHKNLRDIIDLKVFVNTQESLKRFWKLRRDILERGHSFEKVIQSIESRQLDYQTYILPQKDFSDVIVQFYTTEPLDLLHWRTLQPKVKLNILLKSYLFRPIQSLLTQWQSFIEIAFAEKDFISLTVQKELSQEELYSLMTPLHFLEKRDLLEGHYGIIQLLFAMLLYAESL